MHRFRIRLAEGAFLVLAASKLAALSQPLARR